MKNLGGTVQHPVLLIKPPDCDRVRKRHSPGDSANTQEKCYTGDFHGASKTFPRLVTR